MRKEENIIILEPGDRLYRYDLSGKMPDNWNSTVHSIEYNTSEYGPKNSIGAIFLYDVEIAAKQVLSAAIKKQKKLENHIEQATITTTEILQEIKLLDLETGIDKCTQILSVLYELGIDVITHDFFNYFKRESFDIIRKYFLDLYSEDMQCRISAADAIEQFFCGHPPYLGQLLTDFGNGQHFKSLLQNAGFEGYVFMEQYASNTYCIFDSNKILLQMHHVFIPEDEIGDLLLA